MKGAEQQFRTPDHLQLTPKYQQDPQARGPLRGISIISKLSVCDEQSQRC